MLRCAICGGGFHWNDEFFELIKKYWRKEWRTMSQPEQVEARRVLAGMNIHMQLDATGKPHSHFDAPDNDQRFIKVPKRLLENFSEFREKVANFSKNIEELDELKENAREFERLLDEAAKRLDAVKALKRKRLEKLISLIVNREDFDYQQFEEIYEILLKEGIKIREKEGEINKFFKRKEEELERERERTIERKEERRQNHLEQSRTKD